MANLCRVRTLTCWVTLVGFCHIVDFLLLQASPGANSAESSRDADIESLNRENDLDIDAATCVSLWDGTSMDHAMAVDALLQRDNALHLDPETGRYPAHFPPAQQDV